MVAAANKDAVTFLKRDANFPFMCVRSPFSQWENKKGIKKQAVCFHTSLFENNDT